MKLTKAEIIVLSLTLAFLAFTAGVHCADRPRDDFHISSQPAEIRREELSTAKAQGLININTADKATLMTLSGIGEVLAGRIIAYREEHGAFSHIDEITRVEGIGNGIYRKICTSITVKEGLS